MTGIERLRRLSRIWTWNCKVLVEQKKLESIADQIEREMAPKTDTSPATDTQNPSCADPADAADVTSDTQKVTRDPSADVSMSAYDLLPQEDRDAIAWVRDHGGLERVNGLLDWVVGHCSTKQQLDFDFWLSGRVMHELGFEEDMADRDEVERRLLARLTPEGMEWLVEAWPRFEDDAPVRFLDDFERYGDENGVSAVTMYSDGSFALNFRAYSKGEHVNRPSPKVLDADGAEIRVGDVLYRKSDGHMVKVVKVDEKTFTDADDYVRPGEGYTHRAPVLAADGRPLREGETVWYLDHVDPLEVRSVSTTSSCGSYVNAYNDYEGEVSAPAEDFTHERPDSLERIAEDIGAMATAWRANRDLFDAQEAAPRRGYASSSQTSNGSFTG